MGLQNPGSSSGGSSQPAVSTAAAPTYTEGASVFLSTDLAGNLRITGSISATNPSVSTTGAAVPASGTYQGINVAGNLRGWTGVNPSGSIFAGQVDLASIAGTTTATGNGVVGAGVQRVAIASDQTAFAIGPVTAGTAATSLGKAEDQASADGDVGVFTLAIRQAVPSNSSSTDGDYEGLKVNNGQLFIQGANANGTGTATNSVAVGGFDGTNNRVLKTDTSGNLSVVGGTASFDNAAVSATGAAVPAKAEMSGGSDGTNLRALAVNTSGQLVVVGSGTAGSAATAVLTVQGITAGTPLRSDLTTVAGTAITGGAGASTAGSQRIISATDDPGVLSLATLTGKYDTVINTSTSASRLPVTQPDLMAASGTATSAANLFSIDMTGYESASIQVTSAGTTCTITYESSNDNVTFSTVPGLLSTSTGTTNASGTTTTVGLFRFPRVGQYFRARVSTYTSGTVTVVGHASITPFAGTGATTQLTGTNPVAGPAASGSAISGNPVRIGARALNANYTALTTGQTADLITTLVGALVQKPYSIPEGDWSYAAAAGGISNTTTAVTIAGAAGAGLRNYLTAFQISAGALGAATEIAIRDGAAGTVIWRGALTTSGIGLDEVTFLNPLKSSANTLLEVVTLTATITGSIYFDAQGYIAP